MGHRSQVRSGADGRTKSILKPFVKAAMALSVVPASKMSQPSSIVRYTQEGIVPGGN